MCGSLSIQCRGASKSGRIFLMMDDSKVVAQMRISEGFLLDKSNPIGRFMNCERIRRYVAKKNASVFKLSRIDELRVGMTGINLSAKVLKVSESNSINTRCGNQAVVANALITDNTGTVMLSLWGEQISFVTAGDTLQISNARMLAFKGEKQLRIGRTGTLKVEHEHTIPA
jgi:replication factor A1